MLIKELRKIRDSLIESDPFTKGTGVSYSKVVSSDKDDAIRFIMDKYNLDPIIKMAKKSGSKVTRKDAAEFLYGYLIHGYGLKPKEVISDGVYGRAVSDSLYRFNEQIDNEVDDDDVDEYGLDAQARKRLNVKSKSEKPMVKKPMTPLRTRLPSALAKDN